jgi:hypothetical protein
MRGWIPYKYEQTVDEGYPTNLNKHERKDTLQIRTNPIRRIPYKSEHTLEERYHTNLNKHYRGSIPI